MPIGLLLIPAAAFLLATAYALDKKAAERRARSQGREPRCNQCGYNLTDNTSGVCPECGTTIQQKTANQTLTPP